MKYRFIFVISMFIVCSAVKSQPATLLWAKSLGNSNNTDAGNSVCIDIYRNVLIAGTFNGTVDFDPGPGTVNLTSTGSYSAFIVKLDSMGVFQWAKSFGGTAYANPATITTDDSGNVVTAGNFFQTVDFDPSNLVFNLTSTGTGGGAFPQPAPSLFIQKLDSGGNFVWALLIGANSASSAGSGNANQITSDSSNIYMTGAINLNGTLDFDPGPGIVNSTNGKAFLVKYDSSGNLKWVTTFGNISGLGASGNSVYFSQGNLYITGSTTLGAGSNNQLMVNKFDLTGLLIWEKRVVGANNVLGYSVVSDAAGNVITTGQFSQSSGNIDFDPGPGTFLIDASEGRGFIQKLDASGNFAWAENFNYAPTSNAVDIDDNIYTTGSFSGTVDFDAGGPNFNLTTTGTAGFIQKLDAYGYLLWAGQFGNSGDQIPKKIVADSLRNFYLAGYYSGIQDFDPDPSPTQVYNLSSVSASRDAFVVKVKDSHVYITSANGDWNNSSTWLGGVVPPSDAGVVVRHTVTVTSNTTCYSLIVEKVGGSVTINSGLYLTVTH